MILSTILLTYTKYLQHPPNTDKFPMDNFWNIYVASIENIEPSIASSSIQLIWDKQKRARSSSAMPNLARRHPYALKSLEVHRALFDKCRLLLDTTTYHNKVLSTIKSDKP